jgi:hypothetical protein
MLDRKRPWAQMSLFENAGVVETKREVTLQCDIGVICTGSHLLESSPNRRSESRLRNQVLRVKAVEREECSMKGMTFAGLGADCCAWTEAVRRFGREEGKTYVTVDQQWDTLANTLAGILLHYSIVTD